jgi:serine O-acetyltransferase
MVLFIHSIAHQLWRWHVPLLPRVVYGVIRVVFSVSLPPSVRIGKGVVLGYSGLGTVVHARAVIGARVVVGSGVTIGGRSGHYDVPVIDDDVDIGTGAKILGPIRIGRNAIIGANAVVIHDVPPHAVVAGVPAKVLRIREPRDNVG